MVATLDVPGLAHSTPSVRAVGVDEAAGLDSPTVYRSTLPCQYSALKTSVSETIRQPTLVKVQTAFRKPK